MSLSSIRGPLALGAALSLFDLLAAGQTQGFRFDPAAAVLEPAAALAAGIAVLHLLASRVLARLGAPAPQLCAGAGIAAPIAALALIGGETELAPLAGAIVFGVLPVFAAFSAYACRSSLVNRGYPLERLERVLLLVPTLLMMSVIAQAASADSNNAALSRALAGGSVVVCLVLYRVASRPKMSGAAGRLALLVAGLIFAAPVAVRLAPGASSAESRVLGKAVSRPVILLTVDTLRADVLSCYGGSVSTPHLDRLASDSIVFRNARSAAPWTGPSFASIMTGLTPFVHGFERSDDAFPINSRTLAEYFRYAGYQTGAVGYNYHLAKHLAPALARGFRSYDIHPTAPKPQTLGFNLVRGLKPSAYLGRWKTPHLTVGARKWLTDHRDDDFFFWLHYFDPHAPYAPPSDYAPVGDPDPLIGTATINTLHVGAMVGSIEMTPKRLGWIRSLYEAEVRYVDAHIGRTLEVLDNLAIYEDALIVMTSDHGEEFFEHGRLDHGHNLYDSLLRVPLMVKLPRSQREFGLPRQVTNLATNAAVTPTLLDLAGIPHDADAFSAPSLLGEPLETDRDSGAVFSTGLYSGQAEQAVAFGNWKYIRGKRYPRRELYDVVADPVESRDLSSERPDVVEQGDRLLNAHLSEAVRLRRLHGLEAAKKVEFDGQDVKTLRSLGYLQ